jgi:hypothetical protein
LVVVVSNLVEYKTTNKWLDLGIEIGLNLRILYDVYLLFYLLIVILALLSTLHIVITFALFHFFLIITLILKQLWLLQNVQWIEIAATVGHVQLLVHYLV